MSGEDGGDGQLYAWQVLEDGQWDLIGADLGQGVFPLVTSRRHLADAMGLAAVEHHDATGLPVRKVRFGSMTIEREIP